MDRRTPSVSDVVRRAVEICDPDDVDQALGSLEEQFEDDDEPITAVENIDERLAIALEGTDYEGENPAVAVGLRGRPLPRRPSQRGQQHGANAETRSATPSRPSGTATSRSSSRTGSPGADGRAQSLLSPGSSAEAKRSATSSRGGGWARM